MKRFIALAALAAGVAVAVGGAGATTPTPTWAGPSGSSFAAPLTGVTFTSAGTLGRGGGITYTYGGVNSTLLAGFSDLEWGLGAGADAPKVSFDDSTYANPNDTLQYSSSASNLAGGIAVYKSTISWFGGSAPAQLQISVTDLGGTPIPLQAVSGYGNGATAVITGGFKSNWQLTVNGQPYLDNFDATELNEHLVGNQAFSSVTGGFYYVVAQQGPAVSISPGSYDFQVVKSSAPATKDFTITNTGVQPLNVSSATTTGSNGFSVTSQTCTGAPVAPGDTCTVTVQFSPTANGQATGSLTLTDDASDSPQSASLNGFGTIPALTVTPPANNFAFGTQTVNTTGPVSTVTLTSSGTTDAAIGQIAPPSGWTISSDTCSNTDLQQNATCTFGLAFSPSTLGPQSGTLSIPGDAPISQALTGTGISPQPFIAASPSSVSFGGVGIGVTASKTVTLTNTGSIPLAITSLAPSGDYSIANDHCTNVSVATSGTCTFDVHFTPSIRGADNGTLSITSNTVTSPDQLSLSGTGNDSHFVLSPNPLDFGTMHVGETKTLTLTFTNSGQDPAHITGNPQLPGNFAPDFSTFTCPQQQGAGPYVPGGSSCSVNVKYTANATGIETDVWSFPTDSRDGTATVTLTVDVVNPKVATPGSAVLPTTALGKTSASQDVTISNPGTTALHISVVNVTGSNPSDFLVDSSACTAPVAAGGSCLVHVRFAPTAVGTRSASLSIVSDAASSPDVVTLSGTGIDPHVSISAPSFGSILLGQSATRTIVISSTGASALTIDTVVVSGTTFTATADNCSHTTVSAGGSCTVDVTMSGASGGSKSATITVDSNAVTSPDSAQLTGSVLAGTFSGPAGAGFGSVLDGATGHKTVTITNSGTGDLSFASVSIVGAQAYAIDGGTCSGSTVLAQGASCTVSLAFSPTSDGPYSGALELTGDGTNSPFDVPLSGSGVSPQVTVNPLGLIFGIQPVLGHLSQTASTQTISVQSSGTSALTVSNVTVSGPFQITGNSCVVAGALPSGTSCQLQVAFVPAAIGLATGQLTITTDGGTKTVGLSGTGTDGTPPTLSHVPANISVEATGPTGAVVSYASPTATDDVDPSPTVSCLPASGSPFALGTTTVTCTARDASNNAATAQFTVTVGDHTAPSISGVPSAQTVPATGPSGALVSFALPTATDLVDGPVTPQCVPASGTMFAVGTVTVTCTATDLHGNSASVSFSVTVTGAIAQIASLQAQVDTLPELLTKDGSHVKSALDGDLQSVSTDLTGKKPSSANACKDMLSFIADASNAKNIAPKGPLTTADSASLVTQATRIRNVLGC